MTEAQDKAGLPPRRSDAEIVAAVGTDPDQAPVGARPRWSAPGWMRRRATCTACCACGALGIGQIEFANRYRLALGTLRNWEQGRSEPDQSAKVLLAAISADPDGVARAAKHAGDPSYLAAGPIQAA